MITVLPDPSRVIAGPSVLDDFSTDTVPVTSTTGGSGSSGTLKDYSYQRVAASLTTTKAYFYDVAEFSGASIAVPSESESSVSVDGFTVSPIGGFAGNASVLAVVPSIGTRKALAPVSSAASATWGSNKVTAYTAGSLAKHVDDAIHAMLSGKSPSTTTWRQWSASNYDTGSPSATANTSLWCAGLDLSWISFCRSNTGYWASYQQALGAMLIHEQYVLSAYHVAIGDGTALVFRKPDGSFVTRTVVGWGIGSASADWRVSKLDSPVVGITPVKTLPAGWEAKLPIMETGAGYADGYYSPELPMMMRFIRTAGGAVDEGIRVVNGQANTTGYGFLNNAGFSSDYLQARYSDWKWYVQGGDSSSPTFLPINGEAVLYGLQFTAGGGPCVPYYRTDIDAAMTSLHGSSIAMQTANLSAFTTF